MTQETPFEFHNKQLGVKTKFLINDREFHPESLFLIKHNALHKRLKSDTCTEKELRKGSWSYDALVCFYSLSQEWRDKITTKFGAPVEEVKKSWFAQNYISDRKAFDFYAKYLYEDETKKLDLEHIELYTYNASVLNTVLLMKNNRKQYLRTLGVNTIDIWASLSRDVNAFRDVPHNLPTTRNSLERKAREYAKEGYAAVISGKHMTKNAAKVKEAEQKVLIEKLLGKHQNLNNEQIANNYNMVAEAFGWKTIDADTIANYRKELDLYTFGGQHGMTNFMHKKQMQVKRSGPSVPMVYWTLDGWDAELLYQKKEKNAKGQMVTTYHNRLNGVVVLDPYNYYPVGYAIGTQEKPDLIREALRNGINHTRQLFGERYKPWQLQSDNYQRKNLQPLYEAMTKHYTPAKVKNSKTKVIEQYFDKLNEKYFQEPMIANWSGHNVTSSPENQPNADYLNKIRHSFPDEQGCRLQIIDAIEKERAAKVDQYVSDWQKLPEADRIPVELNEYLRWFGEDTGFTNKLQGQGLTPTILGDVKYYDSFDMNFRKHAHVDWLVKYDPEDLSQVLVINALSKNGKLVEEIGTHQFLLQDKFIQPMALYDRKPGDAEKLQEVFTFNKNMEAEIINRQKDQESIMQELYFKNPRLETLQKIMLVDSAGQHKDQKSTERQKELPQPRKQPMAYDIIDDVRNSY